MTGRLFEIREFTLHDGPGIRTTVFLKGCPLRCAWCHNPEGQSFAPEPMRRRRDAPLRTCGEDWTDEALAEELLKNADILTDSHGGVTFSGGEPLAQPDFVLAVTARLHAATPPLTVAVETSGAVAPADYRRTVAQLDFVYQDLKHHDPAAFARWCGGDLNVILENLAWLKTSGVPFVVRVPAIPGVNDAPADRAALRALARDAPNLRGIEFLPYNPAASAKYALLGRDYPYDSLIAKERNGS